MAANSRKRPNSNSDIPEEKKLKDSDSFLEMEGVDEEAKPIGESLEVKKSTEPSSPQSSQVSEETMLKILERLDSMNKQMNEMSSDIKSLKISIEHSHEEVREVKQKQDKQELEIKEIRKDVHELSALRMENIRVKKQLLELESYNRRENLLFENIPEQENENCALKMKDFFSKALGIKHTIQLQRVHRLGPRRDEDHRHPRPIIARFLRYPDREEVWHARTKLRGTSTIIREDFPEQIEAERRTLLPIFKAAKQNKDMKARLTGNKQYINRELYTVENLHQLPKEISPRAVSEKVINTETGRRYHLFQGRLSPFSNMHPAPFTIQGKQYPTVEHYYVCEKARFAH